MMGASQKALLIGYGAFETSGGMNPAGMIAESLNGTLIDSAEIRGVVLPVDFEAAPRLIEKELKEVHPEIIFGMGVYPYENRIRLERIAVNLQDYRLSVPEGLTELKIPDIRGAKPVQQPVIDGGPAAYFANVPVDKIVDAIRNHGIPAKSSFTAGTYACNMTLYVIRHVSEKLKLNSRGGFIHLPSLPEQAMENPYMPFMELDTMIKAVKIAVSTAADELLSSVPQVQAST